jgi:CubicO group peptidase (beta-lactamase class C family)
MRRQGIPGISLAVIEHREVLWAQGFGWRDVQRRLAVDTNTRFQAGSISKPVTALAVLGLSAAGKVDLDADVNRYLKGWRLDSNFPANPVTLRELLCHRAGTVPHGFAGFGESKPAPSLLDVLSRHYFLNGPVKVKDAPGSRFRYSGGGYCVVQKTVEDVTGESFDLAMSRVLLQPLGMTRSHFHQPPSPNETENTARGYGWIKSLVYRGRWGVFPQKAAAGLWTTPADLARLIIAVQKANAGENAGPISTPVARQFLKAQFDPMMGLGVFLDQKDDYHGFFHGGFNPGYFSRFGAGVSNGRAWVIMSNGQRDRFDPILKAVFQEFGPIWEPPPAPRPGS